MGTGTINTKTLRVSGLSNGNKIGITKDHHFFTTKKEHNSLPFEEYLRNFSHLFVESM